MLISIEWLRELIDGEIPGALSRDARDIARVLTARGVTVDTVDFVGAEAVLDIDVPANRPDLLGHVGVARELAAALGLRLKARPVALEGSGAPVDADVVVRIEDPDLCARYTARLVRGVRVGPSPEWVVARLEACGLRSVNGVVDVSNLVMLETGHPNHTFDHALVRGRAIVVRRARPGEILATLDGALRKLEPDMLVIADAEGPTGLAGVMGGAASEIRPSTRDVLIEAAWFDPRSIRATARRLGMSTDASQRFERGADPEGVLAAQEMCVRLLSEICSGTPAPGLIDAHPRPAAPRRLAVRLARVETLLGYAPTPVEAFDALAACGLAPREAATGAIEVEIPSWRVDLEREADLVEEIAKHLGYHRIPESPPASAPAAATAATVAPPEERVRDILGALGFHEAFNYAMIGPGEDDAFVPPASPPPLALANPLAEPLSLLRRSVLPGLVRAAATNLRRGVDDVRLFEVGRTFLARGTGAFPAEPLRVAFAWSGSATPPHWSAPSRPVDLWDAIGLVEAVVRAFRPAAPLEVAPDSRNGFQAGRSACISGRELPLAWCGVLERGLAGSLGAPAPILAGEIDLDAVAGLPESAPRYAPLPRLPRASRDLAVVVSPGTTAGRLLRALSEVEAPAPASFEIVDRYEGPPLGDGEAALTVRVILQPFERTLTDVETESYRARLVEGIERVSGARLRS